LTLFFISIAGLPKSSSLAIHFAFALRAWIPL